MGKRRDGGPVSQAAIDNVRLQDKIDELNRSAILADLRAKIMGEQLRIKGGESGTRSTRLV